MTTRASPRLCKRRVGICMNDEGEANVASAETSNTASLPAESESRFPQAPSFAATTFTDFVENAQEKLTEYGERIQELDTTQLLNDIKTYCIGLVDNALAGDWLNRGELYGAVQLVLVVLLLRKPGLLDGLVGFIVGPATLVAGAVISGKAAWDLGRKQISIWPSPVPDAELRTAGLYQYIRHPVYAGLLLASLGFAVSTGSPERLAITAAMGAFLVKKIEVEEKYLGETYPEWAQYCEQVQKKLIPKVW